MYDPGEQPLATDLPPDPTQTQNIAGQWDAFLGKLGALAANPNVLTAGTAFGTSLMTPRSFGDNAASQVGRAIGSAGETVNRREAMDLKDREVSSKEDLRSAQADAASARMGTSAARLETEGAKLGLRKAELDQRAQLANVMAQLRTQTLYQNYVRDVQKNRVLDPSIPLLTKDQWIAANPGVASAPQPDTGSPDIKLDTPDPLDGRTATGPGGKKMIRRNGQWEPM